MDWTNLYSDDATKKWDACKLLADCTPDKSHMWVVSPIRNDNGLQVMWKRSVRGTIIYHYEPMSEVARVCTESFRVQNQALFTTINGYLLRLDTAVALTMWYNTTFGLEMM